MWVLFSSSKLKIETVWTLVGSCLNAGMFVTVRHLFYILRLLNTDIYTFLADVVLIFGQKVLVIAWWMLTGSSLERLEFHWPTACSDVAIVVAGIIVVLDCAPKPAHHVKSVRNSFFDKVLGHT
jgi:hypothetical protein